MLLSLLLLLILILIIVIFTFLPPTLLLLLLLLPPPLLLLLLHRLLFTLTHYTDRSLVWNKSSLATSVRDVAEASAELVTMWVYYQGRSTATDNILLKQITSDTIVR